MDLRQVQQDAGTGGAGQDQDAALEHRIQREGEHQQVAEEGKHQQLSGGDQPGKARGEQAPEIHGGQPDAEDDHAQRGGHGAQGAEAGTQDIGHPVPGFQQAEDGAGEHGQHGGIQQGGFEGYMLLLTGQGEDTDGPGDDIQRGVEHGRVYRGFRRVGEKSPDNRHAEKADIAHDGGDGQHAQAEFLSSVLSDHQQDQQHEQGFPGQGEKQEQAHLPEQFGRRVQIGQRVYIQGKSADIQQDDTDAAEMVRPDLPCFAQKKAGQQIQQHEQHVAEGDGKTDHGNSPHSRHYIIACFVRTGENA